MIPPEQLHLWQRRIPFLAALLFLLAALTFLFRPLWFDEVLTIDNFVIAPPLSRIYFLYEIPNNHIVFSFLEKLWIELLSFIGDVPFFLFRGFPVLTGCLALYLLARRMVRSCGFYAGGLFCFSLALSSVYGIFATGLRGYILGFLWTVLLILLGEKLWKRPSPFCYAAYFLLCLLAVGTTPTNLAALEGVALFYAPLLLRRKRGILRSAFLFLAPPAALALFYAPIHEKFFRCLKLGEGWFSAGGAVWNLYVSFGFVFAGLLPFVFAGVWVLWKKFPRFRVSCIAGILTFLLPLPAFFIFRAPAFPRVFFPLFPVWILLAAYAFSACLRQWKTIRKLWYLPLVLQIVWGIASVNCVENFSDLLFRDAKRDDLTSPYYARSGFHPPLLIQLLQKKMADGEDLIGFATFDSDYPSVLFALSCTDLPEGMILADPPNKPKIPAESLRVSGKNVYLISGDARDLEQAMQRFGFRRSVPVHVGTHQRLDQVMP